MENIRNLASTRAAVIFTKSSCHMCYSIQQLFYKLGANPEIHELDKEGNIGKEMENALIRYGCKSLPAVFIGGKYVGSAKDIISLHLDGSLKQILLDAQAIWL